MRSNYNVSNALLIFSAATGLLFPSLAHAQLAPASAEAFSYFPQLADGGPAAQRWVTSFTFTNPDPTYTAYAILYLYGNGQPLVLDMGKGTVSQFSFSVPPFGTVTYTSSGTSATERDGWAIATSTMPLESVARYQYSVNGSWQQGVSVPATPATFEFMSPITAQSGIALANPWSSSIAINIEVHDEQGKALSNASVNLGPLGHTSFPLTQVFSALPSSFRGSVRMSGGSLPNVSYFTALVLSGDGSVLSSYPSGTYSWPPSEYQRVWKVYNKVLNTAASLFPVIANHIPSLTLDPTTSEINAYAKWPANTVTIDYSLAELLSDSDSELAFVIGHELGHIVQFQSGKLSFVPADAEWDADVYGFILSLSSGYDPYAVGGAFGKLMMATGTSALETEQQLATNGNPHGSFNDRIAIIFQDIVAVCQSPSVASSCATLKSAFHPHLPPMDPMMKRGSASTTKSTMQ